MKEVCDVDFTKEAKQDKVTPTYLATKVTVDDFEFKNYYRRKQFIEQEKAIEDYWRNRV